jgi:hypothetical protein
LVHRFRSLQLDSDIQYLSLGASCGCDSAEVLPLNIAYYPYAFKLQELSEGIGRFFLKNLRSRDVTGAFLTTFAREKKLHHALGENQEVRRPRGDKVPGLALAAKAPRRSWRFAFEKLPCKLTVDETRPGFPVVKVCFAYSPSARDQDLKLVASFPQLGRPISQTPG